MQTFCWVTALILTTGGLGGFASYLLQPPPEETRSFWGAVRFIIGGAIVALSVPLFLSLAQSALIKSLFDTASGDQPFQSALVLVGFCVVAGFASRQFMDTLAARMMQVEQVAQKAEEKSKEAKEASVEAVELVEENIDRVAEASQIAAGEPAVKREPSKPRAGPISAEVERLAGTLKADEMAVLAATTVYDTRTLTGISRDAKLPRETVAVLVPKMVANGVLEYTKSANTGGTRIQLSSIGVDILNNQHLFTYQTPSTPTKSDAGKGPNREPSAPT